MTATARVDVVTFGCRLNLVESEAMRRQALAAGQRDLTIVNSCAVTAEASRQARQAVRRARRAHPQGRVVVTGCASEVDRAAFAALPEVDAVVPNAAKTTPEAWGAASPAAVDERGLALRPETRTRGFVEIQNGCDHRCTFCIIPFGRGASRSVEPSVVIDRVKRLVDEGVREVVLTGVDVTAYQCDGGIGPGLGRLVAAILAACPDLPRLRLSSLDCVEADPLLLETVASEPRLMPHLHLSVQCGSDLILKRMKRRHGRDDAIAFCAALRRARPEIVFGADFIAGFPTETEPMFADTLDLLDACGLTHIHVFPFSPRPGTPAARMPCVPGAVVKERAGRLRAAAAERLRQHLAGKVGQHLSVLTERGGTARAADFTLIRLEDGPGAGHIVEVLATGHDGLSLTATRAA